MATIELLAGDLLPAALQLIQFLDAAHSGHGLAANATKTPDAPAPLAPVATLASKVDKAPLLPIAAKDYHVLAPELASATSTLGKPIWLRLPDGTEHQVKNWKDILIKAADLVLHARADLLLPLLDKAGKKTALVRWERPNPGLSHTAITYQGKPAFICTNYSAAACVTNARYLLALLPKSKQVAEAGIAFQA